MPAQVIMLAMYIQLQMGEVIRIMLIYGSNFSCLNLYSIFTDPYNNDIILFIKFNSENNTIYIEIMFHHLLDLQLFSGNIDIMKNIVKKNILLT